MPSCSNREDTVHPQWLLDSTANNWYDIQSKTKIRERDIRARKVSESSEKDVAEVLTTWNQVERELLVREMAKYGRNIRKISETIRTKTEAEIQALIDAEYGVNLDTPVFGLDKHEDRDDVPAVVQEEIVTDDTSNITNVPKKTFRKKTYNTKNKNSLLKPNLINVSKNDLIALNPSEIFYEEDLTIGSTESIGSELELSDIVSKNLAKYQKAKIGKRVGNHRRKVSRNYDKSSPRSKSKDLMKSPQGRQRKDSSLSEDSTKSPKMQIVLGSGQALPLSEGEQVIKIEKKKDSEPESDIEIDVDSDKEDNCSVRTKAEVPKERVEEAPIAVPLRNFEPMPRRQKKINLDGGGGFTIMHTESGDLYQKASEPRKERQARKQPIHLIQCRIYNSERPAPFTVSLYVSALISMDVHAHTSRGEVMGLLGGELAHSPPALTAAAYRPARAAAGSTHCDMDPGELCRFGDDVARNVMGLLGGELAHSPPARAAAGSTHCDMDPVSQAMASEMLQSRGWSVCGWHHSHPSFPCAPSALDLRTQRALQRALAPAACLGLITSQHWPVGRSASQYRCIRVEDDSPDPETPAGYQFSVKLVADLTPRNLPPFLEDLADLLVDRARDHLHVDMNNDVCPQAKMTYLNKCLSSVSHHLRSAGYSADDDVTRRVLQGIRDVLR